MQLVAKAKHILEKNQYLPSFYDPIIKQTLDSIVEEVRHPTEKSSTKSNTRYGKGALCSSTIEENALKIMHVRFTNSTGFVSSS